MRIIIVGAGKVGSTIAAHLAAEGHDLVIIDKDAEALQSFTDAYDVMGILGNGASYEIMQEAGAEKADLMIAAAESDELNILCCMFARKHGAKSTIARVRNPEYYGQLSIMQEELGLSMAINPEYEAACEIARLLRYPSALKVDTFSGGSVEIVEFKLKEGSPLIGRSLLEISAHYKTKVLICAVQRGEEVIIPNGSFVLAQDDKISVTAAGASITAFFKEIDFIRPRVRNILIVGGGRVAYYLTQAVADINAHVKIIEIDQARAEELSEMLPRAMIINADGSEQETLHAEGLSGMDAFVTLTGNDEENIVLSMFASALKVPNVITKINRISFLDMLGNIGVESVVSPKYLTADMIMRYVRAMGNTLGSNVETLHKVVNNKVEALEFHIRASGDYVGVPIKELPLKDNLLLACLTRDGRAIIPGGNDMIQFGDRVVVVTTNSKYKDFSDIMRK